MARNDTTDAAKSAASAAAASVAGTLKESAGTLKETGLDALADVRSRAAGAASRTAEAARAEAMTRGESAKATLADEGNRLANTLRQAVEGGDDSIQARVLGAVADSVDDLTETLRNRDVQSLLSDAQAFARRNPGAFVAAAALAGFALARFARSSAPRPSYDPSLPAVSQGYATMPPAQGSAQGAGGYGSPRPMGTGYAASSVSTHSMTTHDDDPGLSSIDAMPDDEDAPDRDSGSSTGTTPGSGFGMGGPAS